MADSSTTSYNFTLPEIGASEDSWGTKLNANWSLCDDLLDGTTAIAPNLTQGSWEVGGTAVTATAAELNKLDGVTASTAELNYVDGVTSAIQTQLNAKAPKANPTFTGTATIPTANISTADFGAWTVTESSGVLYFKHSGTNKMKLDSSGNLTVTGNVTAYGTV